MEVNIVLNRNRGYQWCQKNNCYYIGNRLDFQAFQRLAGENDLDEQSFKTRIAQFLDGIRGSNFALVAKTEQAVHLIVDNFATLPLYYAMSDGGLLVTDNPKVCLSITGAQIDNDSQRELEIMGYTIGSNTIIKGVEWILPGNHITINTTTGSVENAQWWFPSHRHDSELSFEELADKANVVYTEVFHDLIESLNGRQAVIPLTSGKDSKTVAVMLKKLGYDNILAFSLGRKGNPDAQGAKELAEAIGIPWKFIEYNPDDFQKKETRRLYDDYRQYAFSLNARSATLYMIPAVFELKSRKLIAPDSVFCPGYNESSIIDGHFALNPIVSLGSSKQKTLNHMLSGMDRLYSNVDSAERSKIYNRFNQLYSLPDKKYLGSENSAFHTAVHYWRTLDSKVFHASGRVYEFFGYEWISVLGDHRLSNFWNDVPWSYLREKWLWNFFANRYLEKPYSLEPLKSFSECSEWDMEKRLKQFAKDSLPLSLAQAIKAHRTKYSAYTDSCYTFFNMFPEDQLKKIEQYARQKGTIFPLGTHDIEKALNYTREVLSL